MLQIFFRRPMLLPTLLAVALVVGLHADGPTRSPAGPPESATRARVRATLGKLPLYFVENRGQVDPRVRYYVQGRGTSVYFTPEGVTFALTAPEAPRSPASIRRVAFGVTSDPGAARQRWSLKLDFVGANPGVMPTGQDPTPAVVSYFKGPRTEWKTGLKTYARLVYPDLWPGIDLVYSGTSDRLKYTFVVKPGADPSRIRLAYRGASAVRLTDAGQLEVVTPVRSLRDDSPYAYQEVDGRRIEVATAYVLDADVASDTKRFGFRAGPYDRSKPLVLDPAVLVYAGYIGGARSEEGRGIAVDAAGNAYVTGFTDSSEATFPVTAGPDVTYNAGRDAFVAKVNAAGTALVYAGYIGGSGDDSGNGIAVDGAGNAYITGATNSSEATFPVTVGPDLTYNGGFDAFVAKVNAAGTALIYAGYIGGAGGDLGTGIAVDAAGNAYVTGFTDSSEATFPVTAGPDVTYNGGVDAFVAKVNSAGTALVYAGYIGGSDFDAGYGIAVDGAGNAYITGVTNSSEATFPVAVGPDLTYNGGIWDAFVAKVNVAGTALVYAGYIGGADIDDARGIAVDAAGNAYVTGFTTSTEATFPVTVGPELTYNGGFDAFVAKVNAAGTALVYAGYIGGSDVDQGTGIAVDGTGNAYVTGLTTSTEATFPVTKGPDLTYNGSEDAFVAKINAAGTALVYAAYIGGSGQDVGWGIAVDSAGNAYVTGGTFSSEATFPVTVGPDLTHGGFDDAFVAKVTETPTAVYRDRTRFTQAAGPLTLVNFDQDPCGSAITVPPGSGGLLAGSRYAAVGVTFAAGVIFPGGAFVTSPPNTISNSQLNTPTPALVDGTFASPVSALGISNIGAEAVLRVFDVTNTLIASVTTDTNLATFDFVGIVSDVPIARFEYDFVSGLGFGGDDLLFTQLVTTPDCTPPVLTVPGTITVNATSPAGAAVSYTVTATDNVDPSPVVVCAPPSGSTFPIGATTVTCTATDASGNSATASFVVIVTGASSQLGDLVSLVNGLGLQPGIATSLTAKLQTALAAANAGDLARACNLLDAFINEVQAQSGKKLTAAEAAQLIAEATRIKAVLGCP